MAAARLGSDLGQVFTGFHSIAGVGGSTSLLSILQTVQSKFKNIPSWLLPWCQPSNYIPHPPPVRVGDWPVKWSVFWEPGLDWIVLSEGTVFSETQEGANQGSFANAPNPK